MRDIDKDYPTLDVFDAIHRELVTIIGHCTFHRSVLQELILRSAKAEEMPAEVLELWREESLKSVEKLRFSDLNKQDKALASAVYEESSRIAESFWNVLISSARQRDQVVESDARIAAAQTCADTQARSEDKTAESKLGSY
mgnify:CR=1 FL=1|jgi:hypothetical protein